MTCKRIPLIVTILFASMVGTSFGDNTGDLAQDNAMLKQRVDKLEKELDELKKMVMQQQIEKTQAAPAAKTETPKAEPQKAESKTAATPQLSEADIQKLLAMVQKDTEKKKPVWSELDIQLYGYIKADASYDTERTTVGDYAKWVESKANKKDSSQFNLTANETRIGFLINGPNDGEIKTSGKIEFDFYGSGDGENKMHVMMRHAFLKIDWPQERFNIIAGQTSDVISPLVEPTLNYSVGWWVGNIGYRRPQIRLTKIFAVRNDIDLQLEGAIARTIGHSDFAGKPSGEDSGYPSLQGRVSLTFPMLAYKPTTVGVSGHIGREKYFSTSSTTVSSENRKFESWSTNLDITQPINEWLSIKGEAYTGSNLDAYLGGIGQGVRNIGTTSTANYDKEIGSSGGWIAAGLGPWDKWRFNLGAGEDTAKRDDLVGSGSGVEMRTLNRSIFANAIYSINKNTEIGLELSQWQTERINESDADDFRVQTSFIYKF